MSKRIGLYPGTFDPVTLGHLDIIARGAKLVDHLILGISTNPSKSALFSLDERVAMLEDEIAYLNKTGFSVEVKPFNSLLMNFAVELNANVIIRGLRAVSDFEYEFQMTAMNQKLNPDVETIFLMAEPSLQAISSRLVKEIARFDGDVTKFLMPNVRAELLNKLGKPL
jgi:pantetheine-phosphate adenylyltransferase